MSYDGANTSVASELETQSQASRMQRSTFEVDTKLGTPTMLENSGANYEDFAFTFKAPVAQQDAALADELEKLEKPDAPTAPHSSLTLEMLVTCKEVFIALCMFAQRLELASQSTAHHRKVSRRGDS